MKLSGLRAAGPKFFPARVARSRKKEKTDPF